MSDHSKCYSCKRFLKDCAPPHDVDTQECKSFIIKSSAVEEIKEALDKWTEEEKKGHYWCPHCKRRTLAKLAKDPKIGESPQAILVCSFCGSSDIEGYEDDKNFNPSER